MCGNGAADEKTKSVKLREDWRQRSKPIPPGGTYPAKDHCRFQQLVTIFFFYIIFFLKIFLMIAMLITLHFLRFFLFIRILFYFLFFLCSRCGLCDTYYIAHVKNACAFLGDGMSRIEVSYCSLIFLLQLYLCQYFDP